MNAPALAVTRRDYDAMAAEYEQFVDDPTRTEPMVRELIGAFAGLVLGAAPAGTVPRVLDAGCGPGQWTDHLDRLGLAARGLDLSPELVRRARARRPDLVFDEGSLLDLPTPARPWDGVLVHFSLIHTPPDLLPAALRELARVLRPGGHLLLAGFACAAADCAADGLGWSAFDHRVSPAFRWAPDALAERLAAVGLDETARTLLPPAVGGRFPAVYLFARRVD